MKTTKNLRERFFNSDESIKELKSSNWSIEQFEDSEALVGKWVNAPRSLCLSYNFKSGGYILRENPFKILYRIVSNRLFVFICIVSVAFLFMVNTIFYLQIVQGETFQENLSQRVTRQLVIPAPRGNIYDRFGRPLAVNQFAFSVQIDPSIPLTEVELNEVILNLVNLLEQNDEDFIDNFPITLEEPFEFTFTGENAQRQRELWKNELNLSRGHHFTAEETINELRRMYRIDDMYPAVSNYEARRIISLRATIFRNRFLRFNPITVAMDVSMDTVTIIEEENEKFRSIFINTEPLRYYPGYHYFAHMVGYIGPITESHDIQALLEQGYRRSDLIGRTGLELAFEDELRGENGQESVIVNISGRRFGIVEGSRKDPIPGNDIFLSVDKEFQAEIYDILESMLVETIINLLTTTNPLARRITVPELLSSLVRANHVCARTIFQSEEDTVSYNIKQHVLSVNPDATTIARADVHAVNAIIADGISSNSIRSADILLVMYEQGIITGDDTFFTRLQAGSISPMQVVIDKLNSREITPHMTNLDPSTGSVVVVDVNSGEVIAAVSYPSYDNNQLVNNFNNEYFARLIHDDPTTPLINRPFMEERPPGSTFKMISGIAAVETGAITPHTRIFDGTVFTRAGHPHPRCWNDHSHGFLNLSEAIAVSCNYFFFDAMFRIGNGASGALAIEALNRYMTAFGLNDPTGIEIGEAFRVGQAPTNISSPELMEFAYRNNPNPRSWTDGETIRTAIGQSFNNHTAATMARHTAGIATRGEMFDLRLLRSIYSQDGFYHAQPIPFDMGLEISDATWDATHYGMLLTTEGPRGTARNIFNGFPMSVGGKTGTAQQVLTRREHTTFNVFAPFDNPQIAVYVVIPFSNTVTTPSPAAQVGRDVIAAYFRFDEEPERPLPTNVLLM